MKVLNVPEEIYQKMKPYFNKKDKRNINDFKKYLSQKKIFQ